MIGIQTECCPSRGQHQHSLKAIHRTALRTALEHLLRSSPTLFDEPGKALYAAVDEAADDEAVGSMDRFTNMPNGKSLAYGRAHPKFQLRLGYHLPPTTHSKTRAPLTRILGGCCVLLGR